VDTPDAGREFPAGVGVVLQELRVAGDLRVRPEIAGEPDGLAARVEGDARRFQMVGRERGVEVGQRLEADEQGGAFVAREPGGRVRRVARGRFYRPAVGHHEGVPVGV
jgi:hypothetical protein